MHVLIWKFGTVPNLLKININCDWKLNCFKRGICYLLYCHPPRRQPTSFDLWDTGHGYTPYHHWDHLNINCPIQKDWGQKCNSVISPYLIVTFHLYWANLSKPNCKSFNKFINIRSNSEQELKFIHFRIDDRRAELWYLYSG